MFYALGSVEIPIAPYLWTIVTALAACVLVLAWTALLDAEQENWLVRGVQRLRLGTTRMRRMLRRRHVDVGRYVAALSVVQLRDQIGTCQACGLTDLCDRALASRGPSRSAYSFCPNRPAVERFLDPRSRISGACFSR